jgi:hypothetical protein
MVEASTSTPNGVTSRITSDTQTVSHGFRYIAFKPSAYNSARIGSLNFETGKITQLAYRSGTHIHSLYEIIEAGVEGVIETGDSFLIDEIQILPTISGRDILAVGKNYAVSLPESFNCSVFGMAFNETQH